MAPLEDDRLSLISPVGYNTSTCGYCTPSGSGQRSKSKSSKSYGVWANNITPETYQQMLDRGWRRSGHYIYRPDCGYSGTCCPQIAIRIEVDGFRPRPDQKRAVSSLQKLIRQTAPHEGANGSSASSSFVVASHKGKYSKRWDLEDQWRLVEWSEPDGITSGSALNVEETMDIHQLLRPIHQSRSQIALGERKAKGKEGSRSSQTTLLPLMGPKKRRFETTLRLADCTAEKYAMFRAYQMTIHGESESKVSDKKGFERFLCKGPLMPFTPGSRLSSQQTDAAIDVHNQLPIAYDLYHMEYHFEGQLVAVGVIDILPRCISSVYLFYDPAYAHLQLGKLSAVREMALVKQIQRKKGMEGVKYYNLGLYIHSCPKMKYKAAYHPAQVLDPETCTWLPLSEIKPQLDRGARHGFLQRPLCLPVPATEAEDVDAGKVEGPQEHNGMELDESEEDVDDDEDDDRSLPIPPPPGIMDPSQVPREVISKCLVFDHGRIDLLLRTSIAKQHMQLQKALECLAAIGELYYRFALYF